MLDFFSRFLQASFGFNPAHSSKHCALRWYNPRLDSRLSRFRRVNVFTGLSKQVIVLTCVSGFVGLGLGYRLYMLSLKTIGVSRAVPITCIYPLFNLL